MGPKRQPGTVHETSGGPGCRAPREARRFAELPTALPGGERRLGTVHETNSGPSRSPPGPRAFCGRPAPSGQVGPHGGTSPPMCPPALRGGINLRNEVKQIASQRGLPRPRSIFGHFLLMGKVATQASDVCLTISQTTALPMTQGKTSPAFRCDRSITRMKAQRSDSLWPLSFDQESGDMGVGRLSDNFSNHRITHGTR